MLFMLALYGGEGLATCPRAGLLNL